MKAFVTGISRGIGKDIGIRLESLGYEVYGLYKSSTNYTDEDEDAEQLRRDHPSMKIYGCDLFDDAAFGRLIEQLDSGENFDVLINNAAEYIPMTDIRFHSESWARTIAVNMTAPMRLSMDLSICKGGRIVNIASTDAYFVGYDSPAYAASKAGLISITKSLSGVLADRLIRVNAIAPGWVDTDMAKEELSQAAHYKTTIGRNASTSEIADAVEFLVSDKATFINGEVLNVDGGYSVVDTVLKKEAERSL